MSPDDRVTSSNIFSDEEQSSSVPSEATTSHYHTTLFNHLSSAVFKVGEEKFIEFSSFTKNAKEVKCYLAPTTNKTDEIVYDTETAEFRQEKDGCYIKGLKQGGVFLCIEVKDENGEKHKGNILIRFLNEM